MKKIPGHSDLGITPIVSARGPSVVINNLAGMIRATRIRSAPFHRALESGINWIDTASIYGLGHSGDVVARALAERGGERPYAFTKCGMIWDEKRNVGYSLRAASVKRECEPSLRRLKVEVLDLYQFTGLRRTLTKRWKAGARWQNCRGKVRWIGVSNASVEQMNEWLRSRPSSLQPHYS